MNISNGHKIVIGTILIVLVGLIFFIVHLFVLNAEKEHTAQQQVIDQMRKENIQQQNTNDIVQQVYCGDGSCNVINGETCSSCRQDCGSCPIIAPTIYCGDGVCNGEESCSTCSQDCGQCAKQASLTTHINGEPYYSVFCDKIDPYNLNVRQASAKAIRNDPGEYSINQLFDIYDWVKSNIIYQNVALRGIPYSPEETLATESGDCKNQAVLIASMIESIGGTAKIIAEPSCSHAYAIVRFGSSDYDLTNFQQAVTNHYGRNVQISTITDKDGVWVVFDPAGGTYPGNVLAECSGDREVYSIDSCLSCAHQYTNMPYTLGEKCYSECPQGTIHRNGNACSPCPQGDWSYNNECVSCQSGYHLKTDGRCYKN